MDSGLRRGSGTDQARGPVDAAEPWPAAIVILQSRRQTLRIAGLGVVMVSASILTALSDRSLTVRAVGGGGVLFFGLGLLVFVVQLVRPGRLTLDAVCITQTSLGRTTRLLWSEVGHFRVWSTSRTAVVAFDDLRPLQGRSTLRRISRSLGADGALVGGWTMPAGQLAALLNTMQAEWRRRAGGDG